MPTTFTIIGSLPGLNEYTAACRAHRQKGAEMKREAEELVGWYLNMARPHPVDGRVHVTFAWYEKDNRRDCDNVAFAKKFILDALVARGTLDGDGRKVVTGFTDTFHVDRTDPRIEVTIERILP